MLPRESVWRKKFENQRRDLERKVQAQLTLSPLQAWSRCEYWNVTLVKAQKLPDSLLTSDVTNLSTGKGFPNLFILLLIYATLAQDPDEKLNHRSRWEKDLVNLWKHCARLNFYFIFFILFNIAQSYIHATVPLCFGPEVQSEPCHMRGLAMYRGSVSDCLPDKLQKTHPCLWNHLARRGPAFSFSTQRLVSNGSAWRSPVCVFFLPLLLFVYTERVLSDL